MKHSFLKPLLIISGLALVAVAFFANSALSTSPEAGSELPGGASKAVLSVEGMSCSGCIYTIKNSLADFDGIADIQVDVAAGRTLPGQSGPCSIARADSETGGREPGQIRGDDCRGGRYRCAAG